MPRSALFLVQPLTIRPLKTSNIMFICVTSTYTCLMVNKSNHNFWIYKPAYFLLNSQMSQDGLPNFPVTMAAKV